MYSKYRMHSSAVLVKNDGESKELARGTNPKRETNPYEGLNPKIPLNEAGFLVEPPVSEPIALERRIFYPNS